MGPLLGMMPSNVLSVETWCIAGHHAQEHAVLCLQPPRIAGHDAQQPCRNWAKLCQQASDATEMHFEVSEFQKGFQNGLLT